MSTGIDQLVYALTEGQDDQHPQYGHHYGNCCGDDVQDLCDDAAGVINGLRTRLQRAEVLLREEQKERLAQADYERTDHCPECGYDMSSEWSAQIHQRKADEIDAFLGDQP